VAQSADDTRCRWQAAEHITCQRAFHRRRTHLRRLRPGRRTAVRRTAGRRAAVIAAASSAIENAIETRGLSKRFGTRRAVDALDLTVPTGSVFGFLGPTGSGKTTTIRMLLGLIDPADGGIDVLGRPMPRYSDRVLPSIGALIEGPAFYPFLSGTANLLRLDAADPSSPPATRKPRVHAALERVG